MNINEMEMLKDYPEVLTAKMISKILGIGYVKALNLIKYGDIKYLKIGNIYRVPKMSFIEWLSDGESKEFKFSY